MQSTPSTRDSVNATAISGEAPSNSSSETHTCPYKDCNKSFSKKYNLKAHLRLHTGEQPFECDRPHCKKKFKWRSSLSSHSIWHTRKDNGSVAAQERKAVAGLRKESMTKATERELSTPAATRMIGSQAAKVGEVTLAVTMKESPRIMSRPAARLPIKSGPATVAAMTQSSKRKRPRSDSLSGDRCAQVRSEDSTGSYWDGPASQSLASELSLASEVKPELTVREEAARYTCQRADSRPASKKRKIVEPVLSKDDYSGPQGSGVANLEDVVEDYLATSPGSPVTSDGGLSEESLDLDMFSCDMLPTLIGGDEDVLGLGADEVGAILGDAGGGDGIFGFASPGCGALNALDTRFGPFELDNIQSFCLSKSDGPQF